MDKAEFVREAPVFYALAIAVALSKGGDVISKNEIRQQFSAMLDDNDPDGGTFTFLDFELLWESGIAWLRERGMVEVKKLAFGPAVYSRGAKFSERWQDYVSTNDGSVFGTYGQIRDNDAWLRSALDEVMREEARLKPTAEDFTQAATPRKRITEEMEPFSDPPDKFGGLTMDDDVASITSWFFENFEDAAEGKGYDDEGSHHRPPQC
jgi:hypothetical protein